MEEAAELLVAPLIATIFTFIIFRTILCFIVVKYKALSYSRVKQNYEKSLSNVLYISNGNRVNLTDEDIAMIRREIDPSRIQLIGDDTTNEKN